MERTTAITDAAALAGLGERLARARLARNLTQADLAHEAGVSKRTLSRLEAGESVQLTNLVRVLRALDLLPNLEALVPEPAPSPLELLRSQRSVRQRAAGRRERPKPRESAAWTWGDAADDDDEKAP